MKHVSLLVSGMVLAAIVAACTKGNVSGDTPADINNEVGEKLFILNQGAYPASSTLDVLDLSTDTYTADFFGKANPTFVLGNTGNDMAMVDGRLWIAMNASNRIVVLDPATGKQELLLYVDSPRFLLHDGGYVYVTSYGDAVWGGTPTKGMIERIDLQQNYSSQGFGVGYQPEGLAILGDKLYVANSGGYNEVKDNTLSVIDIATFLPADPITLPVSNLNRLFSAGGKLWVSTYDTYAADYSITEAASLGSVTADGTYTAIPDVKPDLFTCVGDILYAASGNQLWKISATDSAVTPLSLKDADGKPFAFTNYYPYGIAVHPTIGDIYIADASFTGDSTLHCFGPDGKHKWQHTTGVGTGPLLFW